ncbi:MAG: restriction modification system specificity domain protein, partial [Gemmatimonadetes bacterium]|nr:restriction modification system specificity domain protein [Gemmatimonadota bacterium]
RSGHPCVRSSDIQDDYLDLSETKQVSEAEYQKRIARGRPVPGDVIYCREGARYGNAARVLDDTLLCLGQRTMLFRPNTRTVTELIWGFLSSASAYRQASRALDGSASPHVNIGEIVAFRVPLPPVVVQEEYARVIRGHDLVRVRLRESVRKAEHLFDSLLQMAFEARL